jgi:hypothetical protein
MSFVRFVLDQRHPESGYSDGPFRAAYHLRREDQVASHLANELDTILAWFDDNLEVPTRFNRTRSKGYYRRSTRGISWLRASAEEHVARMERLVEILREHGYAASRINENRVGYMVYEDEHQVVAEPFADTIVR